MNAENKPLRVLIADDHAPTRDDVRRALDADERFSICSEVADAAEAVQAAMRKQPDICLLDIRMPGSGLAAAWEIAARLPRVKIVMLTVSDEDTDLFTALRAGADGYLLKTMNMDAAARCAATASSRARRPCRGNWSRGCSNGSTGGSRAGGRSSRRTSPKGRLTSREWEVLALLARRYTTAEIAASLVLSASAVRAHITAVVRKLGVQDRAAAAELFRERSSSA